jgi:dihydrofolate reductase/thymidylate synthase
MASNFSDTLNLIVAHTFDKNGIGKDGSMPWSIPEDLEHFKELTTRSGDDGNNFNIVIMGRKTWESIPAKFKPLRGRYNVVLSNDENYRKVNNDEYAYKINIQHNLGVFFTTWNNFFNSSSNGGNSEYISVQQAILFRLHYDTQSSRDVSFIYHIIGGEQIYKKAIESGLTLRIYATEIYSKLECDTFFPQVPGSVITEASEFKQSQKEGHWYRFITSIRGGDRYGVVKSFFYSQESAFLDLMSKILEEGQSNDDRTGVGTLSVFGEMLKYNLRDTFPLCTTKKMFIRGIFEELMFYLSGKTDNKILVEKGVNVWTQNTSADFLAKRGLGHYEVGDLGETYGFNFRHFGAEYKGCSFEYNISTGDSSVGYDQVANVINLIKNEPASRRIIIDLWNCSTIHKAALPPCLCKYQFHVNTSKKELNLAIYLRSSDTFLASNWNACTGAIFVHLLCNLEGIDLTPGELTVFIADAHLYKTHIEQVKEQISRSLFPFPKLIVKGEKKKDIMDFKYEDLSLIGYRSGAAIKAEMAV